jgi:hypothetical protein
LHRVVHDHSAVAVESGGFGERGIGTNADCHDDEIGRNFLRVL